jgi:4-hydroxy-3-methylbut-2-en-1-yl diphosphate reductase
MTQRTFTKKKMPFISREPLTILLAKPRGFCAGVVRAVDIVERAIHAHGAPVYVRHEIVHNTHVVEKLRAQGAVFVGEVDQIPEKSVTIFSAHGVSQTVERAAQSRQLDVIDATCPLVLKVHHQGQRYAALGYDVILIGHAGHAEVEGTLGQIEGRVHVIDKAEAVASLKIQDPEKIAYITQTTLSVQDTRDVIAALQKRFPAIIGPDTRNICYATQNRQAAVQAMANTSDLILIIGSASSSNSSRLREIAEQSGVTSYLIEGPDMIDLRWFESVETLGLSAGASAPEQLVQETIEYIRQFRDVVVKELEGVEENVVFRLPPRLAEANAA